MAAQNIREKKNTITITKKNTHFNCRVKNLIWSSNEYIYICISNISHAKENQKKASNHCQPVSASLHTNQFPCDCAHTAHSLSSVISSIPSVAARLCVCVCLLCSCVIIVTIAILSTLFVYLFYLIVTVLCTEHLP